MSGRLLIPLLLLVSCVDVPNEPSAKVITAIYDPSTSNLPTPNDLALVDGKVAIANNPLLSDAENLLKAGFNGKNGFSPGSTARVQFSDAVSAASITELNALAFDLTAGNADVTVTRTYADCDRSLTLASPTGFQPGHTYLFALTDTLRGANGEAVIATPAFHFLRSGQNLEEHPNAFPGKTRAEKAETAKRLEAVRKKLEPLIQVLETKGVPRHNITAAWSFTVHTDPEALFDPGTRRIPFPNDLLLDPKTGRVALPVLDGDSPEQKKLKATLNQLDGFSTTAALTVSFTTPVDRTTLGNVKLLPATDVDVTVGRDGKKIVLQPRSPLLPGAKYVVSVAGVRDTAGRTYAAMPLAQLLSLTKPLIDANGHSTLSNLCDDTAARLEGFRSVIGSRVTGPQQAAWSFTTLDIGKAVTALQRTPYDQNLPLQVFDAKVENGPLTMLNVGKIVSGKLTTFERLDPVTRAFEGPGKQRNIDFVLALPRTSAPKVKVVVFGHGLYTSRQLGLMVADRLARAGFATFAIDLPLHGDRTLCRQNADCSLGATCAPDGSCVGGDLARLPPIPGAPGKGVPTATGQAWVDVENLGGTRDHFRQAIIDLSATTRLIRELDWSTVTGGTGLDGDAIDYAGISLGGIVGAEVAGADPHYKAMLLNVGGAGLVDLLRESLTFSGQLSSGLAAKGIHENTDEYDSFVNAARWVLDEIDPINVARFARTAPLNGAAKKKLRLHMAIGDAVVPNTSTRRLITATGIDEATEFRSFIGSHAFLADPAEPACYVGQDDMASFLEAN